MQNLEYLNEVNVASIAEMKRNREVILWNKKNIDIRQNM